MKKTLKMIVSLIDAIALFGLRIAFFVGTFWLLAEVLAWVVNDVRMHGFN